MDFLSIKNLANEMKITELEAKKFLRLAPNKYKVYTIPKRTIGRRVIAQPSRELKEYQYAFLKLQKLPIHSSAYAYRKGIGIKANAYVHAKNKYLLKLDLASFFNSIKPRIFWKSVESNGGAISEEEKAWFERLLFWCPSKKDGGKLVLSIGAPSSPLISNFIMYDFDVELSDFCNRHSVTYTRYADDLTFSTNVQGVSKLIIEYVREILNKNFNGEMRLNETKIIISSKRHNRRVTGVTLNNDGNISLGRAKKRYIKHLIHRFTLDQLNHEELWHLWGNLAFILNIEPSFWVSMRNKYGDQIFDRIKERLNDRQID